VQPTFSSGSLLLTHEVVVLQGKTWECFLVGHAALDALTGEADRKRILLERFQAEVRETAVLGGSTQRAYSAPRRHLASTSAALS
jgi:hypothetical protein